LFTSRLLLVDFKEFCADPEATVRKVLDFVGADTSRWGGSHSQRCSPNTVTVLDAALSWVKRDGTSCMKLLVAVPLPCHGTLQHSLSQPYYYYKCVVPAWVCAFTHTGPAAAASRLG